MCRPFVDELNILLKTGIQINEHYVNIRIRCFVCDSPARAFLKGVTNFNGRHGCQKCVVVGEWSHDNRTMSFPHYGLPVRTDQDFRNRTCSSHHKAKSPLEDLPIDMIKDIIVAEELHLIHLGYMKRCLFGWRDGTFKNYKGKWTASEISSISQYLWACKMPRELHRTVRGLDYLSNWKGLEFRTFFHYISIAVLKNYLEYELYEHFLLIFCAITICSSNVYSHLLDTAKDMIICFVEMYISIYGIGSITSNIHNLAHVVEEVNRFGILSSMNAYPFENKLYHIKRLLRHGKYPMAQAANRLTEMSKLSLITKDVKTYPICSGENNGDEISKARMNERYFYKVEIEDGLYLSNEEHNKWFLTKNNEIVGMENSIKKYSGLLIYGTALEILENVFEQPIRSSYINIFKSNLIKKQETKFYCINDIKCKLVMISQNQNQFIFIPLIHTLDLCNGIN